MPAKYFLDANILIYTVGNITPKKQRAVNLITSQAIISTQTMTESINVMHRKLGYDYTQIRAIIDTFLDQMTLLPITSETIRSALQLAERYGYAYVDFQALFPVSPLRLWVKFFCNSSDNKEIT